MASFLWGMRHRYGTDVQKDTLWTTGLVHARLLTEGAYGRGTRIERTSRFLGRQFAYTIDITEVEPGRRVEMITSAGPFPMQITYLLEPVDGGTRMSIHATGEPRGFFALTGPLMAGAAKRSMQNDVDNVAAFFAQAGG